MRGRVLIIATVVLAALGYSPAAAPHGGGAAKGYSSTITSVTPRSSELEIAVLDADDRIQLRVRGDHVVIIHGYEGEPYLRFSPNGVERNSHSPATYLNDDRYGNIKLPPTADPKVPPAWETVAPASRPYDWHDHRIHWMSTTYPPVVAADKTVPHHVFNWKIPGTIDDKPLLIQGSLDYAPLPGQKFPTILIIPLAALAIAGAALVFIRNRQRTLG